MNEFIAAAERFAADLTRAGAGPGPRDRAVWAYLRALSAPCGPAWTAFYRAVYRAVRDVPAGGTYDAAARAAILALCEDDFGAALFSADERQRLWAVRVEERRSEASLPP